MDGGFASGPEHLGERRTRQRLAAILDAAAARLASRALILARGQTPPDLAQVADEAGQALVKGLFRSLPCALRADRPLDAACLTECGAQESWPGHARRLKLFLGLLGCCRTACLEELRQTAPDEETELRRLTDILFSRLTGLPPHNWPKRSPGHAGDAACGPLLDEAQYRPIFEKITTPVMVFDNTLTLLDCNLSASALLRAPAVSTPGTLPRPERGETGSPWRGRTAAQVVPWLAEDIEEFLHGDTDQRRIETAASLEGVLRTYQITFSRLLHAARTTPCVVAEISDISSLRHQEKEAREGRTLLRRILDGVEAAILVVDPGDLSILYCNDKASEITGRSRIELLGGNFADIEFLGLRNEPLQHQALLSSDETHREMRLLKPDASIVPVIQTVVTAAMQGELKVVSVLFDISRQKEMERQLMQSQKLESIGQLAAGIAHEINTPIQYVGGNVEFLETAFAAYEEVVTRLCEALDAGLDAAGTADVRERVQERLAMFRTEVPQAVAQTKEGVERVSTIVQGIRRFSHPGGESRRPTDLNKALTATLEVARNEWKHIAEAVFDLDPDLPLVWCSPGEINQVFLNIVVNAAHAIADKIGASGGKGRITVATRRDGDGVAVLIGDTGTGIKPEHRNRIFDPFFTTKIPGRGTGQGLAIAHSIIDQHGGDIGFESTPGLGTEFCIRLPLGAPGGQEAP